MEIFRLSYSKSLFQTDDGTPITFCVKPSEDSNVISKLIKAGGGEIVKEAAEGVIFLSSNGLNLDTQSNVICSSFIYACCFRNTLLDEKDFRIVSGDNTCNKSAVSCWQKEDGWDSRLNCRSGTFSTKKIYDMLICLIKCEDVWKKLEDSEVFENCTWRNIRKNFCFWALEKINGSTPLTNAGHGSELVGSYEGGSAASSSSCPIQSSLVEVSAEPHNGQNEKDWEERVCAWVSEKEKDSRVTCGSKNVFDSSSDDTERLDSKESESEKKCLMQRGKRKVFHKKRKVSPIIESEESSGALEEEEGTDALPPRLERRDEVVSCSGAGEKEATEPCGNQCSTVGVKEKKGGMDVSSSSWLGKHIFEKTDSRRNISATSILVVNDDLESDSSETSEERNSDEENSPRSQVSGRRRLRMYTMKEDLELLNWICERKGRKSDPLKGNCIWKFMEKRKVLEGRSWQSMRERFRRHIVPNLKKYNLSEESLRKIKYELG